MNLNGNLSTEGGQMGAKTMRNRTQWAIRFAVGLMVATSTFSSSLLAQTPQRNTSTSDFRRMPLKRTHREDGQLVPSHGRRPLSAFQPKTKPVERILQDEMVYQVSHTSDARPSSDNRTQAKLSWTYQLQQMQWKEFESKLTRIWGERIEGQPLDEEGRIIRLFLPEGSTAPEASMKFDRIAGELTYEGAQNRLGGWHLMMQLLDRAENPRERYGAEVIDIGMADSTFVRHISHTIQAQDDDQGSVEIPKDLSRQDLEALRKQIPKLSGKVEIRINEETNTFIIFGDKEDIEQLERFINEVLADNTMVNKTSTAIQLFNSEPDDLQDKIQTVYDAQFADIHGPAQIISNPAGNNLLVVGSSGAIGEVSKLVRSFDGVAGGLGQQYPDTNQQELTEREKGFKTFFLKYISAIEAQNAVLTLFGQNNNQVQAEQRQALPVTTQINQRSNSLTVIANPGLIRRADALIKEMDVDPGDLAGKKASRVLRVFQIRNHQAGDFAAILQDALNGGQQLNLGITESTIVQNNNNQPVNNNDGTNPPITPLAGLSIADENGNPGRAGDFFDVRITADNPSNSIIVQARAESMELIEQLIQQLDKAPQIEADVKVFQIINGDAAEVLQTLTDLFGADQAGAGAAGGTPGSVSDLPLQSPASDGTSLINIRFAVNARTNTITASGSQSDLEFVEALIYRLDERDVRDRQTGVYRLSNANVVDLGAAIRDMIDQRQAINDGDPLTGGGANNSGVITARRNIIIVEEVTSNSLIVNARPEHFAEIEHLIYSLDRRPPMVKVKAMIVEVDLNQLENFGVEFGIQDSEIFTSGLVDTIGTGFVGLDNPAGQLLSDLGVGRASAAAGISGLILSAGDESLNFVIRSLKQKGCANVLFSPEVMTVENLTGAIEQGATIQRLGGVTATVGASQQTINDVNVGISLEITPRVTPDGMIVMFVDVSNTSLGSVADGTSLGTDQFGTQIISQPINLTAAQTTIMARSGQTVAISGLLQEEKAQTINSVPFLGDLPVIGPIFQSVENTASRSELLIILTPFIVDGPEDIAAMNQDDFNRMHWCKCDVAEAYGDTDYNGGQYFEHTPKKFYPASDPLAANASIEEENVPFEQTQPRSAPALNEQLTPQPSDFQDPGNGSGTREGGSGTRLEDQPFNEFQQQYELPAPQSSQHAPQGWQPSQGQAYPSRAPGYPEQSYRQQPTRQLQNMKPASAPRNFAQQLPAAALPAARQPYYTPQAHGNTNQNYAPSRQMSPAGPLPPQRHSNSNQSVPTQHNLTDRGMTRQTYTGQPSRPQTYQASNGNRIQQAFNQPRQSVNQSPGYRGNINMPQTNYGQNAQNGAVVDHSTGKRFRLIDTR